MRSLRYLVWLAPALALAACGDEEPAAPPDHIVVDHILIGVRNPRNERGKYESEAEARKVAYELLERLQGGANWAEAKKEHSEDPPPGGPYGLANRGVQRRSADEFPRDRMVPAFGDVGFSLRVGEIGIADFHPADSPFGFHIIKRIE